MPRHFLAFTALFVLGCSPKMLAVNALGNALSGNTSSFATDEDPELVGQAVPFALKTIESLLAASPKHPGMLRSASSGFAQYAYGWVQLPADSIEEQNLARATELRARAKKLYLRSRGYALRGLELRHPGFAGSLAGDAETAVRAIAKLDREDLPFLYWASLSWGGAIALAKNDSALSADLSKVESLLRRGLELDEGFAGGGFHSALMAYEAGRSSVGGSFAKAEEHFRRAEVLSKGVRAMLYLGYAESLALPRQDRAAFAAALEQALAIDPDAHPEFRLENILAQQRARWLLQRTADLFLE
jgi:predicted anti-sigma-YlaC factor YlaD